ncbi:MAG: YdeI/OmpD-associated family protein, partial [Terracidiphilus sp.]
MPKTQKKTFTALLEPDGTALKWTIARLPFDFAKAWPERRGRRVKGEISSLNADSGGFAFRTSLFPDRRGKGEVLLVNKKMQKGAHARMGDKVRIVLEPDLEEREILMPPELAKVFKGEPGLRKWFDGLGDYTRRAFCAIVAEVKSPEARVRMAERVAERLLLTL